MIDYTLPLDQLPDPLPIEPLRKPFDVTITPPGSKSITCRAYVLAALQSGWIINPLVSDDTEDLRNALMRLGASFSSHAETPNEIFVAGVNGRFPKGGKVIIREGGAPTRFMIAAACLANEPVLIDASGRMRERPIAEGVELLRKLGALIDYQEEPGRLPVQVRPSTNLRGGRIDIPSTASSQFISALMLIAPFLEEGLEIRFTGPVTSEPYVRLTAEVLRETGAHVAYDESSVRIARSTQTGGRIIVEPDATATTYWLAAAAISYSARIRVCLPRAYGDSFTAWQGDWQFHRLLTRVGAIVEHPDDGLWLSVRADGALSAIDTDMSDMPDAAITLAILCAVAGSRSRITGLRTLRVKETDRIAALANELRKIGCTAETGEDWISIEPPKSADALPYGRGSENPVTIETYNDHRMAMAFAILGLVRPGISIRNPACVKKSYPGFWKDFAKLYAD